MDTYTNFISQFEISEVNLTPREGFHRHHIFPVCEQKKQYGDIVDNRQTYVTKAQHLWLHILYDKENGTETRKRLASKLGECGLHINDIHCYEDCLPLNDIQWNSEKARKTASEIHKGNTYFKDHHHKEETKKSISDKLKGKPKNYDVWNKGKPGCFSKETLEKMSKNARWLGTTGPNKDKHWSQEKKDHISQSLLGNTNVKDKLWWTNGEINTRAFECPGDGWFRGMTRNRVV